MHFITLVAVNVGKYPVSKKTDKEIKAEIEKLFSDKTNFNDNSAYVECRIGYLRALTNSFARAVDKAVEFKLAPYYEGTEEDEYLVFHDQTDDIIKAYEAECVDCIKFRSGVIVPYFRSRKYCIKDGKVYQRDWGPFHQTKRTKKAKRLIALLNYPVKKLYKSYKEYAEDYCGLDIDREHNAFGYYDNPNSFWDWYRIGGRWPCSFLVKEDCDEYSEGDYDWDDKLPTPPEGYKWTSAARKKDIQWDVLIEYRKKCMAESYESLCDAFKKKELPKDEWYLRLKEDGIYNFEKKAVYLDGESFEENQKRRGYLVDSDYLSYPCYYVDKKTWHVKDSMWGVSNDDSEWKDEVKKFYDSLSNNTVLVSVDCHV